MTSKRVAVDRLPIIVYFGELVEHGDDENALERRGRRVKMRRGTYRVSFRLTFHSRTLVSLSATFFFYVRGKAIS